MFLMCSHQCVTDVTCSSSGFLLFNSVILVYIYISPFWRIFVVERTHAWHWWCCKQLQNQKDVESKEGGGVVWRDMVIYLVFKNGGTSPAFSCRLDSEQEDERVHFLLLSPETWWPTVHEYKCSLSLPMPHSCTRPQRSGFAQCTACRWALRCTFWSCWYLGWTWLWTDWWPTHATKWNTNSKHTWESFILLLVITV